MNRQCPSLGHTDRGGLGAACASGKEIIKPCRDTALGTTHQERRPPIAAEGPVSDAEHRNPYVQVGNGCTVAGVVPLAALSGRPRRGPAPNWLYEEYDPPNT